ncbi:hypothetical protein MWH25_06785 [Natroniella acetigena]|uniref:hypothetical protein n=1 Tax=Natroniella acetigena TaxID=52004 RepID=UPI00200B8FFD|nr:hypothetical protein [Natroniella acetigena]MCK8827447.1 hypothetical protein [Natroniella acetigena]
MENKTTELTRIALLAVLITVSGIFKIPGPAGSGFQLSAPIAVAIAAVFGFRRYILAGLISSGVGFIFGTQTIIHITIAMIFRGVAGGLIALVGPSLLIIVIAGPLGSIAARFFLSLILSQSFLPLVIAAVPGIIFTAVFTYPLIIVLRRVVCKIDQGALAYG